VYITNPRHTAWRFPFPEVDYNPSLDKKKKESEMEEEERDLDFSLQIIMRRGRSLGKISEVEDA
jgi:hypothetical protein